MATMVCHACPASRISSDFLFPWQKLQNVSFLTSGEMLMDQNRGIVGMLGGWKAVVANALSPKQGEDNKHQLGDSKQPGKTMATAIGARACPRVIHS